MKKFTLLLILLVAGFVLPRSFTTAIFAETKTETLTVTGVKTTQTATNGGSVDTDLLPNDGTVVWHAKYDGNSYAAKNQGAQFGKQKYPFNGTLTLTKSAIPDHATITAIKLTIGGAAGGSTYKADAYVAGEKFGSQMSFSGSTVTERSFSGSQTITTAADNIYISFSDGAYGFKITNIEVEYEEPSTEEAAVSTPVITGPDGTFFGEAEVSISGEEDASIYYTLDGTEPTASSTLYTEAFKIKETTTVKAIAIKGEDTSYVATKVFTAGKTFATIAALIEAAPASTETVCITGPVVVSANNNGDSSAKYKYLFVQDTDGAHGLNFGAVSSDPAYTAGQTFKNVIGTFDSSTSGVHPKFTPETSSLVAEDGTAPEPIEKTISELFSEANYNIYVKFTNQTVSNTSISDGSNTLKLYSYIASTDNLTNNLSYDIEGIYAIYSSTKELLLTSIEQHVSAEKPATPVVTYNGEAVEAGAEVAVWPNESIKVSIDGATSYKVNGGEATTGASFTITTDDTAEAVSYSIVGVNDIGESDTFAFTYKVKEPADIAASYRATAIDGSTAAIVKGNSVTLSADGATSFLVNDEAIKGNTYSITTFGEPIKFTAKNAAGENSASITFTETNEVYQLTTSTADLVDGDLYIVAASGSAKAMSSTTVENATDITKTGNYIVNPSDEVLVLKLTSDGDGGWKFMTSDNEGLYLSSSSSSKTTELSANPTSLTITYSDKNVVSVKSSTSNSLQYNSSGYFRSYSSSQSAIALYHLVKGEQAFTKTTDDNDSYLFGGKAVVLYAEGEEVWLELGSTHFYGIIDIQSLGGNAEDLFEINKEISYFEISTVANVENGPTTYYEGVIESTPLVVSEESVNKKFEIINDGAELTKDYVGKIARVHGTVESNVTDDNDNPRMTLTSGNVTYTIVKRFNKRAEESSSNVRSRAGDEDEADDNTTTNTGVEIWNSASDEWNTFAKDTDLYVGGVVGLDKDLGVVLYPTVISTNENNVTSKIDMPVDSEIMVIGNSIVSEGASVYNLSGARVQPRNLAKGVYIVRLANGTARKIAIK
jgi:hypothetical protein